MPPKKIRQIDRHFKYENSYYEQVVTAGNGLCGLHAFLISMYYSEKDPALEYIVPTGADYFDTVISMREVEFEDEDDTPENLLYSIKYMLYTYIGCFINKMLEFDFTRELYVHKDLSDEQKDTLLLNLRMANEWRDLLRSFFQKKGLVDARDKVVFNEDNMKPLIFQYYSFISDMMTQLDTSIFQDCPDSKKLSKEEMLTLKQRKFKTMLEYYHQFYKQDHDPVELLELFPMNTEGCNIEQMQRGLASLLFALAEIESGKTQFEYLETDFLYCFANIMDCDIVVKTDYQKWIHNSAKNSRKHLNPHSSFIFLPLRKILRYNYKVDENPLVIYHMNGSHYVGVLQKDAKDLPFK